MLGDLADVAPHVVEALTGGGVILVGERAAEVPGLYSAVAARWPSAPAPRSPGCRGGRVSAARSTPAPLPTLLPGGRPVADAAARAEVEQAWGLADGHAARRRRAATPTRSSPPPRRASWPALVVGGVDPDDLPDPAAALAGAARGRLPGQPGAAHVRGDRAGRRGAPGRPGRAASPAATVNWEGRRRAVRRRARRQRRAARRPGARHAGRRDGRRPVHPDPGRRGRASSARLGRATPASRAAGAVGAAAPSRRGPALGQAVLATWRQLLDDGRARRSTSRTWPAPPGRRVRAAVNATTAERLGLADGDAGRRCAPSAARSRCRWRSPTCPTAWSGCRRTPPGSRVRDTLGRRARRPRGGVGMSLTQLVLAAGPGPGGPDPHARSCWPTTRSG